MNFLCIFSKVLYNFHVIVSRSLIYATYVIGNYLAVGKYLKEKIFVSFVIIKLSSPTDGYSHLQLHATGLSLSLFEFNLCQPLYSYYHLHYFCHIFLFTSSFRYLTTIIGFVHLRFHSSKELWMWMDWLLGNRMR